LILGTCEWEFSSTDECLGTKLEIHLICGNAGLIARK